VFVECNKHLVPFLSKAVSAQKTIFSRICLEDMNTEDADAVIGNDSYTSIKHVAKNFTGNKFYQ
jgi:16S rRNA processing protein RimM